MASIANYADETAVQQNIKIVKGDKKAGPVTGGALNLRGSKRGSLIVLPKHNPGAGISGSDGTARPMRIGFAPPEAAGRLREQLPKEICGACGVPSEMLFGGSGQTVREAWRVFGLRAQSRADRVAADLSEALGQPVGISVPVYGMGDLQSWTRALKMLVDSGVPLDQVRQLTDLEAAN